MIPPTRRRSRGATRRESLVEVHFKQAVGQDDPANPSFETIQILKRLRSAILLDITLDSEIAKLEKRLFPGLEPVAFATLAARVREAEKLLRSEKTEEVEKGQKMMTDVVKMLPR